MCWAKKWDLTILQYPSLSVSLHCVVKVLENEDTTEQNITEHMFLFGHPIPIDLPVMAFFNNILGLYPLSCYWAFCSMNAFLASHHAVPPDLNKKSRQNTFNLQGSLGI